ncbi:MAG: repair protein SbcD/Mre11, partial [Bacteroidota bacterium]|nr:repair protein SbcD/Mre11 [Bacteroidota bacterium]
SSWVNEQIADSNIEVLKLQNRQYLNEVLTQADAADSLDELNEMEVFDRLLEKNNIPDEQKTELKALYKEIIDGLHIQNMVL